MGTKVKKRFTDDFKKDAVNLVVKQGYINIEAAKSLGISESAIRTWIKKFGPNRDLRNLKKGGSLLRRRKSVRYQFIDEEKKAYPITILCRVMKVHRCGYYSWRKRCESKRFIENQKMAIFC